MQTLSLLGFRDYRADVTRRLVAAGHDCRAIGDRAIIAAWLDNRPAADLVAELDAPTAPHGAGGAA
jgi:hypothetical protein